MHKKSGIVKYILPSAHGLLDHILKTVFAKDRYRGYGAKSAENRNSVFERTGLGLIQNICDLY